MPVSADGILQATFDPEWATTSLIVDGGMWPTGSVNEASDPAATAKNLTAPNAVGWQPRWFGAGGAGATTNVTGATDGPEGITSYIRNTWTTAPTGTSGDTGFDHTGGCGAGASTGAAGLIVSPGETYTVSAYMRASRKAGPATHFVTSYRLRDAAGALVSSLVSPSVPVVGGEWQRISGTITIPAGVERLCAYTDHDTGADTAANRWLPGDTLDGTGLLIEKVGAVRPYFDGSRPRAGIAGALVSWSGVPNASPSLLTVPEVAALTIARMAPGEPVVPVRGIDRLSAAGGSFIGSDSEGPLDSLIGYTVTGYSADGAAVASASVMVDTSGAAPGIWVKVPGRPSMTVHGRLREVGAVQSDTIGGSYQVLGGGGSVSQTTAHFSGVAADKTTVGITMGRGAPAARLKQALLASRIVLLQPVGVTDLDAGWYYVPSCSSHNPGGFEDFPERWFDLAIERTAAPAGEGQGVPGVSWAAVTDTYATWADVVTAVPSWFDLQRGA